MVLGDGPVGDYLLGSGSLRVIPKTQFNIPDAKEPNSIILISDLLGKKLIEYFRKYPDELRNIHRRKFEEFIAELFTGFGYDVELTQKTRDGGKDIIAVKSTNDISSKYLIECKRPDIGNPVGVGVVRELMGVKSDERATMAIAVTTTHFTPDARQFYQRNRWELELKEYKDILGWIEQYMKIQKENL